MTIREFVLTQDAEYMIDKYWEYKETNPYKEHTYTAWLNSPCDMEGNVCQQKQ